MKVDFIAEKMGFRVKRTGEYSALYCYDKPNGLGETLEVEVGLSYDCNLKNSLPKLWKKWGWTRHVYKTWWSVRTFVYNGNCIRDYNPTIYGRGINFRWLLEATEENFEKILAEILARFTNAKPKPQ